MVIAIAVAAEANMMRLRRREAIADGSLLVGSAS